MSKAFTKEDDDTGFTLAPSSHVPEGPFQITSTGAKRVQDAKVLANAEILAANTHPERAALGVTVVVRGEDGTIREHRLVTAEEYVLFGDGVSVHSPLGRALLGAEIGDVRELRAPKGKEELEVMELRGEDP